MICGTGACSVGEVAVLGCISAEESIEAEAGDVSAFGAGCVINAREGVFLDLEIKEISCLLSEYKHHFQRSEMPKICYQMQIHMVNWP